MSINPLRDAVIAKYAGTSSDTPKAQDPAPTIAPVKGAPPATAPAANAASIRDQVIAKYSKPSAAVTAATPYKVPSDLNGSSIHIPDSTTSDSTAALPPQTVPRRNIADIPTTISQANPNNIPAGPAPTPAELIKLSGTYETTKLEKENPSLIDPGEYFKAGLSFGHELDPTNFIAGEKVQPSVTDLPPAATHQQKIGFAIGQILTMSLAQPLIESAAGSLLSQVPGGTALADSVAEASKASPFKIGYPVALAKSAATGALFGSITKNKDTLAHNILNTAGTFAAFTALAYPVEAFFKPIIEKVGESIKVKNPNFNPGLLNDPEIGQPVTKEVWFKNPKDPTQLLRVNADGVQFWQTEGKNVIPVNSNEPGMALSNIPGFKNLTNLDSLEIQAFKEKPSVYENLRAWLSKEPVRDVPFTVQDAPGASVPGETPIDPSSGANEAPGSVQPAIDRVDLPNGMNSISVTKKALENAGYNPEQIRSIFTDLADKTRSALGRPSVDSRDVFESLHNLDTTQEVLPPAVSEAVSSPITSTLLDRVANFSPVESAAFGKKIIDTITESVGGKPSAGVTLPENVDLIETKSQDGRPAQFKNGRIEIFQPNLAEDLATLAKGGRILAHEGEYSTVYEKLPNESMADLGVRYVKDIILHEAAHQKTLTFADGETAKQLNRDVIQARLSGNSTDVIAAQQKLDAHMKGLETKANSYLKENRTALEKEIFKRAPGVKQPNQFERNALGIPNPEKVTISEKNLLRERMKNMSAGARAGVKEGKTTARAQEKNIQSNSEADIKRQAELDLLKEKITDRSRFEKTTEAIHNKYMSALQKRTALIDYADLLPYRERGKFLRAIRNVVTEKEFANVLNRMREAANLTDRRVLIQQIQKELAETVIKKQNGLPKTKFAIDEQKILNNIRAAQRSFEAKAKDLRASGEKGASAYALAQIEIANKISTWQTGHPNEVLPVDVLHEIEILKTVGLKDQSAQELRSTLASIQSIKETGRTAKELERFNRDTEIQRSRDKIYDVITGGEGLPSDKLSIKNRQEKGTSGIKQFARDSIFAWEELLDKLSVKDKGSKAYESYLSKFAQDKSNKAFDGQNRGELGAINDINELMKKAYGIEEKKDILGMLGDLKTEHKLGPVMHTDGVKRNLMLSRGEAIQYYMWAKDPTLDNTFEETLKWGADVHSAIEEILTPEDKKMGDALLGFYKEYYKGVNAVFSKEYGIDLPFNENYSPVHRAIDVTTPENVLLAQEGAKYATAKNGSLKDRVKNNIDLKAIDAFENAMRHIVKMEHYKAWSDTMFNFRKIFGDTQVRQAIIDFHGKPYLDILDNFVNDMARDGVSREKVVQGVDAARGRVAKALLGFNWHVGVKQLTGVMNYGIELPTADFVSGTLDFWKNPITKARFLFQNSAGLQERFSEGHERDIKTAISKGYDKRLAKANNFSEMMFVPIRNADKLTVLTGSWAAFQSKYTELAGHPFEFGKEADQAHVDEAINFAENITARVQESSRLDTLAPLQRGGSWAKLFTMFQSQPSKYLRIMVNVGRNYRAGRQDGTTAIRRILWAWIIVPFLYNLVADQFIAKKYRESSGGLVTRTLLGPLSYPLIIGQMYQQVYGWVAGETFDYQPSAVFGFMDDLHKAITGFQTGDAVKGTTYLLDAAGKGTGVPTTILTKPIRNAGQGGSGTSGSTASF